MDPILAGAMVARLGVMLACGGYLLARWLKGNRRYLTDFPFWFGLTFVTIGIAKIVDLVIGFRYLDGGSDALFLPLLKTRFTFFGLTAVMMMVVMVIIWFRGKRAAQAGILGAYAVLWVVVVALVGNVDVNQSKVLVLQHLIQLAHINHGIAVVVFGDRPRRS